jgi:hypothetical protein
MEVDVAGFQFADVRFDKLSPFLNIETLPKQQRTQYV